MSGRLLACFLCVALAALGCAPWRQSRANVRTAGENGASAGPETAAERAKRANVPEGAWIWIDVPQKALTLYRGAEQVKRYAIATGAWTTPTPIGTFRVTHRFSGDLGGFGTRFLGLNVPWGQFGIHGTNKPGSIGGNASHGCVRMLIADSEELYRQTPNGAKVVIQGGPYGPLGSQLRILRAGDRNSHVAAVQRRLNALGYYGGGADGVFGQGTQAAVRKARTALGLPAGDQVDPAFYGAIGLCLFE